MQNIMRKRRHNMFLWTMAFVLLLASFFDAFRAVADLHPVYADGVAADREAQIKLLTDRGTEALKWKMKASGAESAQELLDQMAVHAGRSPEDWYVLAMAKMGLKLDYSAYANGLFAVCKDPEPTDVEQYRRYLVARAMGYESIPGTAPEKLKNKGIMSVIYRGYAAAAGRASEPFVLTEVKNDLLALKLSDGGYALMGEASDVDVTGFALQMYGAIAAASGSSSIDAGFRSAINEAFASLARKQQADGGYASFGTPNSESGAMVLLALAAFSDSTIPANERGSIDAAALITATERYRTSGGGYAHALSDGVASMENDLATAQVMCAYASYAAYLKGGSGNLYPIKVASAPVVPTQPEPTKPSQTQETPRETVGETTKGEATQSSTEDSTKSTAQAPTQTEPSASAAQESESAKEGTKSGTDETTEGSTTSTGETSETSASGETEVSTEESEEASTEGVGVSETDPSTTNIETTSNIESSSKEENSPTNNSDLDETKVESPTSEINIDTEADPDGHSAPAGRVRGIMAAIVLGLMVLALLANALSKRKSKATYVTILVLGVAALIFVLVSKITLPEQATLKQQQSYLERLPAQGEFRVTISIDQRIEGEEALLTPRLVTVSGDDTVFDILDRVTKAYGISIDYTKSMVGTVYVRAIGGHAEFDRGAGSGWVFLVNGELATTDAGSVTLSDGDELRWAYTLDLGKDVSP